MTPLKLIALDADDLAVLSAHAQDAVLRMSDLAWRPGEKRFALACNRFAWEKRRGFRDPIEERRNAVIRFDRILGVKTAGIARDDKGAVLSLLAIRFEPGESPSGTIELVFSGGGAIRLEAECIEAELADLGGAWEALARPAHDG